MLVPTSCSLQSSAPQCLFSLEGSIVPGNRLFLPAILQSTSQTHYQGPVWSIRIPVNQRDINQTRDGVIRQPTEICIHDVTSLYYHVKQNMRVLSIVVHFRRWSSMVFLNNLKWSSTVKKWSSTVKSEVQHQKSEVQHQKKWSSTPVELDFFYSYLGF